MPSASVLITGASSDIGCALIRDLLSGPGDSRVLAHSFRSEDKLKALQEEFGDRLCLFQADCADPVSVSGLVDEIAASFGTPSGFVHLPALRLTYDRFTKFKWDRFEQDLAIQVRSAVMILQRFLPKMSKAPGSRIVFVLSSVVTGLPPKFMSMYTMSKYTQLGLMRALAAEYAGTSVRINAISPGMVDTQFLSEIAPVAIEMSSTSNPMGRNARPDDLLGALRLLLSPAAEYIHGVNLPITGGLG